MAVFDTNVLLLLLDQTLPAPVDKVTGDPVTDVEKRLMHLVATLQESREKVIIPTPVLAEVLTRSERAGADYFTKISQSAAFRIESFEIRAAIELARMTATAIDAGDKRAGVDAPWGKVQFDRQIVAIAKVHRASTIYSDDKSLKAFAAANGINVVTLAELPLPPESAQLTFAWDVAHENETPDEE